MFEIYQDKSDFKEEEEEEEKAPLGISNDIAEDAEDENHQSLNPELSEQKSTTEETEDIEKETGTEEIIESDKVNNEIFKYFIGRIATLNHSLKFLQYTECIFAECSFSFFIRYFVMKMCIIVAGHINKW